MQDLITRINGLLDPTNSASDIDNAVESEKYVYENMPKRLISDSITRLLAYRKKGVVAAYLELEKLESKDMVKRIFVCSKNHAKKNNKLKNQTENLLRYCRNMCQCDGKKCKCKFLTESLKNRLAEKLKELKRLQLSERLKQNPKLPDKDVLIQVFMDLLEILNGIETDPNTLPNIFEEEEEEKRTKSEHEKIISIEKRKKKMDHLRFILILFCDCITLPSIFNYFIEKTIEIPIHAFDQNADRTKHSDTLMAQIVLTQVEKTSLSYNKYIGLSFMPCFYCSIVFESYGFEYRGRVGKLFTSWTCPDEMNEFLSEHFTTIYLKLKNEANATISNYESKTRDLCQAPHQVLYSDDICHLARFCSETQLKIDDSNNKIIKSSNNETLKDICTLMPRLKKFRDFLIVYMNSVNEENLPSCISGCRV
jgi:hypothetical protein